MTSIYNLTDKKLLEQIDNCTLDPRLFTHETMLRLTWILLQDNKLEDAIIKNCELKEKYFIKALNSDKFNFTLTKAYTEILDFFMKNSKTKSFEKLLREYPRLKYNFNELVKTHFGYNILKEHRIEETNSNKPILFTF